MDIQTIQAAGMRQIAESLECWAHQRAAAVAFVEVTTVLLDYEAVTRNPLLDRRHLTVDGQFFGLLLRADARIQRGADVRLHA